MKLKDLAVDHDYYCSDSNYYNREPGASYDTWSDFIEEYEDADIDMNLCFRWDIKRNDSGTYYMEVFMMYQRKGVFAPHYIGNITEDDVDSIRAYISRHWDKLKNMWMPVSDKRLTSRTSGE